MKSQYIGVDFDGTCVGHNYPEVGEPLEDCIEVLKELMKAGHKLILYTLRHGESLELAVEYLKGEGIELYAVNENPSQKHWNQSPKIHCHLYIDDAALGCPLVHPETGRPTVDWSEVYDQLVERGYLEP